MSAGPIQVPSNLSNLKTPEDIVRFLSAFAQQMASQFNSLLSTRIIWGTIGASGQVFSGSSNFIVAPFSFNPTTPPVTTDFSIRFREAYTTLPTVVLSVSVPLLEKTNIPVRTIAIPTNITMTGFDTIRTDGSGNSIAASIAFIAMGNR